MSDSGRAAAWQVERQARKGLRLAFVVVVVRGKWVEGAKRAKRRGGGRQAGWAHLHWAKAEPPTPADEWVDG